MFDSGQGNIFLSRLEHLFVARFGVFCCKYRLDPEFSMQPCRRADPGRQSNTAVSAPPRPLVQYYPFDHRTSQTIVIVL